MKVPRKQSHKPTPRTPQATLIPDQGTTPISRKTARRTHAGDVALVLAPESASKALRAKASGRGKKRVRKGERGAERRVASMDPMVVSTARSRVAKTGEKRAPASTFFSIFGNVVRMHFQRMKGTNTTNPKNTPRNRPRVHPNSCSGYDPDNVSKCPRATLRVAMKFTPELGKVGQILGP